MRQTPQKTFWRILGVLLAFVMVLALVPRTTYAANYSTKDLRMAKNETSYTVKVNYPVVGYVDATVKLTMTENKPFQDFVDGKMYRNVGLKVEYELKKSALNKIKKNAAKILKSTDGKMIYDFEVFVLDGKTGKVITSSQASDIKVKYQPYQTMHVKMFGKLPIIYKQEYTYGTKKFSVKDEQSFIFGVASPNKVILSADGKTGNKNFKNAQKFWNGKVALKNSIYYNKSQKNRALWIKYEQKVGG